MVPPVQRAPSPSVFPRYPLVKSTSGGPESPAPTFPVCCPRQAPKSCFLFGTPGVDAVIATLLSSPRFPTVAGGPGWVNSEQALLSNNRTHHWRVVRPMAMRGICVQVLCQAAILAILVPLQCSSALPYDGQIRLVHVNGTKYSAIPSAGRLEVFHAGEWGTVCDDFFDGSDADVACRQLGYAQAKTILSAAQDGHGWSGAGRIWMDDVSCTGTEVSLVECMGQMAFWGDTNCGHDEDVGLVCQPSTPEGEVRLLGGKETNFGCAQVFHDGVWGTVCASQWNQSSAKVLCRQLGFHDVAQVLVPKAEAAHRLVVNVSQLDMGKVWLEQLSCTGSERRLVDCSVRWGTRVCSHNDDVIVWCNATDSGPSTASRNPSLPVVWRIVIAAISTVLLAGIVLLVLRCLCKRSKDHEVNAAEGRVAVFHARSHGNEQDGHKRGASPTSSECSDDTLLISPDAGARPEQAAVSSAALRPDSISIGSSSSSCSSTTAGGSSTGLFSDANTSTGSGEPSSAVGT